MSSVLDQYVAQEAAKAADKASHAVLIEVARNVFGTGKLTPEEIAEAIGLSVEETYEIIEPKEGDT